MVHSRSFKGKPCPYKPITCQEGWCSRCQIYKDYQAMDEDIEKPWYVKEVYTVTKDTLCLQAHFLARGLLDLLAATSLFITSHTIRVISLSVYPDSESGWRADMTYTNSKGGGK